MEECSPSINRRRFLLAAGGAGASLLATVATGSALAAEKSPAKKVTADEDLMREHGVLRRVLLIYRETAVKLRNGASLDPKPLYNAAMLFRKFGEDYHEKKLEEAIIFPFVRTLPGDISRYPDILQEQHRRGREITDFILTVTSHGVSGNHAHLLAQAFDRMDRMYANHTAREDTVLFPA